MNDTIKRVLGEGYRVFFLSAGVFAVLALGWWEFSLAVDFSGAVLGFEPYAMVPRDWHGHELVFGYGGAALGGFLLTAVPNWTGAQGARHWFIGTAAAVWLAGRLAMFGSGALAPWLVAGIYLAFLPILWVKVASLLIRRPKPANMVFLLFLALLWAGNLATHLGLAGLWEEGMAIGIRAGLLALAGMILVIGGRIGPAFTRNAMHREGVSEERLPRDWPAFTPLMLGAATLLPLTALIWPGSVLAASVMIAAGLAQLVRQATWGIGFAARRPILASLHLSIGMVALGLLLMGLSRFTPITEVGALHLLAIGGIGGTTLAVMSRATLGHSGRPLIAPRSVALAYALLPLAALLRLAASEVMGALYAPAILAAGAAWSIAFSLYIVALWPALTGPRPARPPMSPPPQ
ncbi:MAG TPA: NnrS family protein [Rhodobacterales bacterium]|nr:NnrS family protein [Rhodobacterales bacterium]